MGRSDYIGKDLSIISLIKDMPGNDTIRRAAEECCQVFCSGRYQRVCVSISGGSDSDVLIDLCTRCDPGKRFTYVYCDTGLEYQATKDHLDYLEDHYGIKIRRLKSQMQIPQSCEISQPFLSKMVSTYIGRLLSYGFRYENESFNVLYARYPRCKAALQFWCNEFGEGSKFNIDRYPYLKEFMIQNPPQFRIGARCCKDAKLDPIYELSREKKFDLHVMGVRKAEGGQRGSISKTLSVKSNEPDLFRPLLHFTDRDKAAYNRHFGIKNSACYAQYGLCRTGCAGCPCGRKHYRELEICDRFEPELANVARKSFSESYHYEQEYRIYRKQQQLHSKGVMTLWDYGMPS